jgi:hypothetical protein
MDRNLSVKKGGVVPDLKTHCRLLHFRPVLIHRSILCSGASFWEPCPDYELCKKLKPPPSRTYLKPLVTEVFDKAMMEAAAENPRRRGRPSKHRDIF